MNSKLKGFLVITIFSLMIVNCGSENKVVGFYMGAEYEASIRNIDIIGGVYSGEYYYNYATASPLVITMSLYSYWGPYTDSLRISAENVQIIEPGVEYRIGDYGIGAKMTIEGNVITPGGWITFTKISDYHSRDVCASFYFDSINGVIDRNVGYFEGSFCGEVNVGY